MKLIKAFIHHVRTAAVVQALAGAGYRNVTLQDVKGMLKPISDQRATLPGRSWWSRDFRGALVVGLLGR